jgi:hypothetical protein
MHDAILPHTTGAQGHSRVRLDAWRCCSCCSCSCSCCCTCCRRLVWLQHAAVGLLSAGRPPAALQQAASMASELALRMHTPKWRIQESSACVIISGCSACSGSATADVMQRSHREASQQSNRNSRTASVIRPRTGHQATPSLPTCGSSSTSVTSGLSPRQLRMCARKASTCSCCTLELRMLRGRGGGRGVSGAGAGASSAQRSGAQPRHQQRRQMSRLCLSV